MFGYLAKRVLVMIPTMFGILVISFLVMKLAPGDPGSQKFGGGGQAAAGMNSEKGTEAAEKRFREKYRLDDPLPMQFGYFLKRLFTGDLIFFQQEKPVWPEMRDAIQVTLVMNVIVFVLIYAIAIPIGVYSAARPNSLSDRVTTVSLFVLYSLPSFWLAELLRMELTDPAGWIRFPTMGLHSDKADELSLGAWVLDWLHHATLPIICQTYSGLAYLSRQMRAGMLETVRQDYIRTAYAKGCGPWRVIIVHALRNGLFPVITLFASLLPFLVGGSVIIENIFNIPGMGRFAFENVLRREYDAVMATLTLSAVLTLAGILVSDVCYVLVNPRVSFESR